MSNFKVTGINHIGLAAKDPRACEEFFTLLGLPSLGKEDVESQKTRTVMFASGTNEGGFSSRMEILEPLNSEGPIATYLEKRGSGIHHVALTVDDLKATIAWLVKHDIKMIDEEPRPGAHNTKIAFVHPKSTGGILVELTEN